jgi:hypothetical protein
MIEPASSKDEAAFELAGSIIHGAMRRLIFLQTGQAPPNPSRSFHRARFLVGWLCKKMSHTFDEI